MNVDWPIAEESTYTVKNEAPDNDIKRVRWYKEDGADNAVPSKGDC
jgi:hypothetical protein